MEFSNQLLLEYRKLMQTTNLQKCYQEIIKLIKYIRTELQKEMPDHDFMGQVVENRMDFSYFQATTPKLKELGLKVQVVFIHKTGTFEVWMSGYNRKIQSKYHQAVGCVESPFAKCENPERNDYILRIPVNKELGVDDTKSILEVIRADIFRLEDTFLCL
ncbi:DUF7000 family protein [Negativibacillus massiliensis]|uniref:DUF7000 family protein n=1 Tax=Negativibacillus massiliensis TaxID=1871035 RepID=UPI003AF29704